MIRVEASIDIGRSAKDVFAYVGDQTNAPRWQRGLVDVRRTTDGPIGVGTRHTAVRTLMGRRLKLSNKYTLYEPNKLVAFEWSGTMPGASVIRDRTCGHGRARLTSRIEMRAPGLFRLAEPLIAAMLKSDVEANLGKLKDLLEAKADGDSVPGGFPD